MSKRKWQSDPDYLEMFKEGNSLEAILYFTAAVVTLASVAVALWGAALLEAAGVTAIAPVPGARVVAAILFVAGIALSVGISWFHTNELQDWLKKTWFGDNDGDHFKTLKQSQEVLQKALEKMQAAA